MSAPHGTASLHWLTLPINHSKADDINPPTRLTFMRRSGENRTARGIASSLPAVIPPQNKLISVGFDSNGGRTSAAPRRRGD